MPEILSETTPDFYRLNILGLEPFGIAEKPA
jgi:hypothetical protein